MAVVMIVPAAAGLAMAVIMVMMLMSVTMIVIVGMAVIMMAVVMAMHIIMMMGAAFGLERPFDRRDPRPEFLQHFGNAGSLADAQPFRADLGFEMAIAQMPDQMHQVQGIAPLHFQQGLGLGHDLDQPAILQPIGIAMGERPRLRQIKLDVEAAHGVHHAALLPPLLEAQHDAVGDGLGLDLGGRHEGMGVEHGDFLKAH